MGKKKRQADVIKMSAGNPLRSDMVTGSIVLKIANEPQAFQITLPGGPCTIKELLPIMRSFGSLMSDRGEAAEAKRGRKVSCRPHCGACCRQLVPISHDEAIAVAELVESMPEPRRSTIRQRFADAIEKVKAAGMIDRIDGSNERDKDTGVAYFRLGIPCPFLEDESCSIYHDRPVVCREYLVTSPPENCAALVPGKIAGVPLPAQPMRALMRLEADRGWTSLTYALLRAEQSPPLKPRGDGPKILRDFVEALKD